MIERHAFGCAELDDDNDDDVVVDVFHLRTWTCLNKAIC